MEDEVDNGTNDGMMEWMMQCSGIESERDTGTDSEIDNGEY